MTIATVPAETPDPDEALWEALREEDRLARAAEGKPQRGPMTPEERQEEELIVAFAAHWLLEDDD
jgi:hypothetical protein